MGFKTVAKEFGIDHSVVRRWVKHFEAEGIKGLEEYVQKGKLLGQCMHGKLL
nr:helix-turn-helix domain-containing protein [Neobacillus fumarioli]